MIISWSTFQRNLLLLMLLQGCGLHLSEIVYYGWYWGWWWWLYGRWQLWQYWWWLWWWLRQSTSWYLLGAQLGYTHGQVNSERRNNFINIIMGSFMSWCFCIYSELLPWSSIHISTAVQILHRVFVTFPEWSTITTTTTTTTTHEQKVLRTIDSPFPNGQQ